MGSLGYTNLKIYTFTTATFGAVLFGFGLSAEGAKAKIGFTIITGKVDNDFTLNIVFDFALKKY